MRCRKFATPAANLTVFLQAHQCTSSAVWAMWDLPKEVRAQETDLGFKFDYIIVCVVTGSTQAGMIVGFKADDRAERVIGIDASGTLEQTRKQVAQIARDTAELVELGKDITDEDIVINPDYAYPAYGVPSDETNDAIRLAAQTEAMITDPVYEGKSMQGMIDLVRRDHFPAGSRILYAHLGGRAGAQRLRVYLPQWLGATPL